MTQQVNGAPTIPAANVTSGTLAIARGGTNAATFNANEVFAGPTSGGAAAPSNRVLGLKELTRTVTTVSTNTTLNSTHDIVLVDTSGGSVTITLPTAVGFTRTYTVKNIGSGLGNQVILATTGGQTIDGGLWVGGLNEMDSVANPNSAEFASNNANWFIIGTYHLPG